MRKGIRKKIKAAIAAVLAAGMSLGACAAGISGVNAYAAGTEYTMLNGQKICRYMKNLAAGNDTTAIGNTAVDASIKKVVFTDNQPASYTSTCSLDTGAEYSKGSTGNITAYWDSATGTMSVYSAGTIKAPSDMNNAFTNLTAAKEIDIRKLDTSATTNMGWLFNKCGSLETIDLSGTDTTNVTSMASMFDGCVSVKSIDLTGKSLAKVKNMSGMFNNCKAATTIDMGTSATPALTTMNNMFLNCYSLKNLNISGLTTANVTIMSYMFANCTSLESLDLRTFDTSSVTSMRGMFQMDEGGSSLKSVDVSSFNTSKVTDMEDMFSGCDSLKSLDLSNFDTSKVTAMGGMFYYCTNLETLDISSFDLSSITKSLEYMLLPDDTALKSVKAPAKLSEEFELPLPLILFDEDGNAYSVMPAGKTLTSTYYFTVSYDANGGTGEMESHQYLSGTNVKLKKCTFEREGYQFVGWSFYKDAEEATFPDESLLENMYADYEFHAIWKKNAQADYTVIHEKEELDGTYKEAEKETLKGTIGTMASPEPKAYEGFESPAKGSVKVTEDGSASLTYKYARKEYDVEVEKDDSILSVSGAGKHKFGEAVTLSAMPEAGYGNLKWSGDVTNPSFTMPAKKVSASVSATPIRYSITYILDGGRNNEANPLKYTIKDAVDFQDPERTGYEFGGWTDADGDYITGVPKGTTGDLVLTAVWVSIKSSASFDPNRGELRGNDSLTISYGERYGKLPTAVRAGRIFGGWYTNKEGGIRVTEDSKVKATKDITLYAHWTQFDGSFNGIFIRNAKDGSGTVKTLDISEISGARFVTEEGFAEWAKGDRIVEDICTVASDGIEVSHRDAENEETSFRILAMDEGRYFLSGKLTLPVIPKDTFRDGDALTAEAVKDKEIHCYGESVDKVVTADENALLISEDDYSKWAEDTSYDYDRLKDYARNEIEVSASENSFGYYVVVDDADGILISKRQEIETGSGIREGDTLRFSEIKSLAEMKGVKLAEMANENEPDPIPVGLNNNKEITSGDTVFSSDVTAAYRLTGEDVDDRNVYIATVGEWEESLGEDASKLNGDNKRVAVPADQGQLVWYVIAREDDGTAYAKKVCADLTFNLTFDANGGTCAEEARKATYGKEYGTLPVPEKDGCRFIGWSADKEGKIFVNKDDVALPVADFTLYAQWERTRYTVVFDPAGGTCSVESKEVDLNGEYGELPVPEKEKHAFIGWADENGSLIEATDVYLLRGDQTLIAKWERNVFTVTFDPNGGDEPSTVSMDVIRGEAYGALPEATCEGFSFLGWFTEAEGGDQVTEETIADISEDITLFAHWEKAEEVKIQWVYTKNSNIQVSIDGAERYVIKDKGRKKLASVKKTGVVKGKKAGVVTITGQKRELREVVNKKGKVKLKKVWVDVGTKEVTVFDRPKTIKAVKVSKLGNEYDANAWISGCQEPPIKWVSSKPSVATVTEDGKVHIVGKGTAKIIPIFKDAKLKKVKGTKPAKYNAVDGKLKGVKPIKVKVKLPKVQPSDLA